MKSILLTTTAIVAFAGVAAADENAGVSFGGSASLGYNDDWEDGFYWETQLDIAMSTELDNGLTAGAWFNIEIDDEGATNDVFDGNNDFNLVSSDLLLSLKSDTAGLYFGDTSFAAESQWNSAGDMEADAFSEADGEVVVRGDIMMAGIDASVSYAVANVDGGYVADDGSENSAVDQLSVGVSGDMGMFNFAVAYQAEVDNAGYFASNGDFTDSEIFGVSAGTSFGGADITVAYASDETMSTNSTGIQVSYPFGPVTGTVYYVSEDDGSGDDNYGVTVAYEDGPIAVTGKIRSEQARDEWNIDGSYEVGNGLTVLAGMLNENEGDNSDYYVAGSLDLGGGATFLASYAEDDDGDQSDEIGAPEYLPGTTVKLTFKF